MLHACWNLLAKRSGDKQAFLWLALLVSTLALVVPFAFYYRPFPAEGWLFILASGAVEAAYFLLLGGAYQRGDLSLVYPLARGSAPLFVIAFAYLFLGERIQAIGIVDICLVVAGIYALHVRSLDAKGLLAPFLSLKQRTSQLALLTGLTIGTYTVVDKVGVTIVGPVPYLNLAFVVSAGLLLPYMLLRKPTQIRQEWRLNWVSIIAVGVLSVGAYLIVLVALTLSKVSYVAPVREISVVFGALLGAMLLREPFARSKLVGSALIFMGIACIGLA